MKIKLHNTSRASEQLVRDPICGVFLNIIPYVKIVIHVKWLFAQNENGRQKTDLVKILWIQKGWSPKRKKKQKYTKYLTRKKIWSLECSWRKAIFFSSNFEIPWFLFDTPHSKDQINAKWISTPSVLSDSKMILIKNACPPNIIIIQFVKARQRSIFC